MLARVRNALALGVLACTGCGADPEGLSPDAAMVAADAAAQQDAAPEDAGADGAQDATVDPEVQVGRPAGSDGLGFAPLEPGQELRLQTFGQGGTHLLLGVRTRGIGKRAFITITLRNLATGAEAVSPPPVRPQLLWCGDDETCDLVPLLAMTAGLVAPDESAEGVEVEVIAHAVNEAGVEAQASERGVLSTKDL